MARRQLGSPATRDSDIPTRKEAQTSPACKWYPDGQTSVLANNIGAVYLSNAMFNDDSRYSRSDGGLVVSASGIYVVVANMQIAPSGAGVRNLHIRKGPAWGVNGSVIGEIAGYSNGDEVRLAASFVTDALNGDVFSLCTWPGGNNLTVGSGGANTWLSLVKIG